MSPTLNSVRRQQTEKSIAMDEWKKARNQLLSHAYRYARTDSFFFRCFSFFLLSSLRHALEGYITGLTRLVQVNAISIPRVLICCFRVLLLLPKRSSAANNGRTAVYDTPKVLFGPCSSLLNQQEFTATLGDVHSSALDSPRCGRWSPMSIS